MAARGGGKKGGSRSGLKDWGPPSRVKGPKQRKNDREGPQQIGKKKNKICRKAVSKQITKRYKLACGFRREGPKQTEKGKTDSRGSLGKGIRARQSVNRGNEQVGAKKSLGKDTGVEPERRCGCLGKGAE